MLDIKTLLSYTVNMIESTMLMRTESIGSFERILKVSKKSVCRVGMLFKRNLRFVASEALTRGDGLLVIAPKMSKISLSLICGEGMSSINKFATFDQFAENSDGTHMRSNHIAFCKFLREFEDVLIAIVQVLADILEGIVHLVLAV